jgi:hypothetical protein
MKTTCAAEAAGVATSAGDPPPPQAATTSALEHTAASFIVRLRLPSSLDGSPERRRHMTSGSNDSELTQASPLHTFVRLDGLLSELKATARKRKRAAARKR